MSFFSEEDKAANQQASAEKAAIDQGQRLRAPRVAENLVNLLEAGARQLFRGGREVTQIRVTDGRGERNFVTEEILKEALVPLVEQRFGRDRSTFTLMLSQWRDWDDRECTFQGNTVNVTFDRPLD